MAVGILDSDFFEVITKIACCVKQRWGFVDSQANEGIKNNYSENFIEKIKRRISKVWRQ